MSLFFAICLPDKAQCLYMSFNGGWKYLRIAIRMKVTTNCSVHRLLTSLQDCSHTSLEDIQNTGCLRRVQGISSKLKVILAYQQCSESATARKCSSLTQVRIQDERRLDKFKDSGIESRETVGPGRCQVHCLFNPSCGVSHGHSKPDMGTIVFLLYY